MARDGRFLYSFISDFYDLIPSEDRYLIAAYWHGLTQVVASLYQEAFETALANVVNDVKVYRIERWDQYQLNGTTSEITAASEDITLTGTTAEDLAKDAILFDGIGVTNTDKHIYYSETVFLIGTGAIDLRYGEITRDTVRVSEGSAIFIEGRDYSINYTDGKISRIADAGIPDETTVTVQYMHPDYTEGLDYTIDEVYRTIARTATSAIGSGDTVTVTYDYVSKVADRLSGKGEIDATANTLTDEDTNFTGVLPGRTLEITSGANIGTYTVSSVQSTNQIKITGSFVADDAVAIFKINAFPYAIEAGENIASIPTMQNYIVEPTVVWREGVDYLIGDEKISFRVAPPTSRENDGPTLWAEETFVDEQTVYRNFGVLIDFFRESSLDYLDAVQGLWYTYWTGSTHENLQRGLHILLGLPFATERGTVTAIQQRESFILDVSVGADFTPKPIRLIPASLTDSITSGTKTFAFPAATGFDQFTASDIGKVIRITGSSAGNDGYYTIASLVSGQAVTVSETVPSNETAGFTARLHEPLTVSGESNVDYFSYGATTFTQDDVGRILRVDGSAVDNDGDYEILEIIDQDTVRCEPVTTVEGPGGFSVDIYELSDDTVDITDTDGIVRTYTVPVGLELTVELGDDVERFQRLTTGIRIWDKNNTQNFIEIKVGRAAISRFLTQNASTGPSPSTDESRALTLLIEHMFLPQVLTDAVSESTNVSEISTFLENLKPQWSEYIFAFAADFTETLTLVEDLHPSDISLLLDLTTILRNAWPGYAQPGQVAYTSSTGEIIDRNIKTIAAGWNIYAPAYFEDPGAGFTDADLGRTIEVTGSASNNGEYVIYKVVSSTQVLVTPDFVADETAGANVLNIEALIHLRDLSATFTTDAAIDDVLTVTSGTNQGDYRIIEILDNNNLLIRETVLDGPFAANATGVPFTITSYTWYQDQGSLDFLENFLHERTDGATATATTFNVNSSLDLYSMGVQVGFLLVIKSGANQDVYPITGINSKTQLAVSGSFPSFPASSQDYAIAQAALVRSDSIPTILEVIPI